MTKQPRISDIIFMYNIIIHVIKCSMSDFIQNEYQICIYSTHLEALRTLYHCFSMREPCFERFTFLEYTLSLFY